MTTRIEPLRAGTLKRLVGSSPYFSRWEDQDYREAEPFVHLLCVAGGEVVMQVDDLPPYDYFLVNGAVELATSTLRRELRSDHVDAGYPVAHLRPSRYRLSAAGASRPIFDTQALDALHELSHGIPRRINRLADLALLVGFADELPAVTRAQIEAVSDELSLAAA